MGIHFSSHFRVERLRDFKKSAGSQKRRLWIRDQVVEQNDVHIFPREVVREPLQMFRIVPRVQVALSVGRINDSFCKGRRSTAASPIHHVIGVRPVDWIAQQEYQLHVRDDARYALSCAWMRQIAGTCFTYQTTFSGGETLTVPVKTVVVIAVEETKFFPACHSDVLVGGKPSVKRSRATSGRSRNDEVWTVVRQRWCLSENVNAAHGRLGVRDALPLWVDSVGGGATMNICQQPGDDTVPGGIPVHIVAPIVAGGDVRA